MSRNNKNKFKKTRRLILILLLAAALIVGYAVGWRDYTQHKTNALRGGHNFASVLLTKYAKNADGTPLNINETATETNILLYATIQGARFELYREGVTAPIYAADTDDQGQILLSHALEPGAYYFTEVAQPEGFDFDRNAGNNETKRYYFNVSEDGAAKGALIQLSAYNRRAKLSVEKTVVNADGTALTQQQKEQQFKFTVSFSEGKTYPYTIYESGKPATGTDLQQGDHVELTLRHGQQAVFNTLPVGVNYEVREVELPEGYSTTLSNREGTVLPFSEKPEGSVERYVNIHGSKPDTKDKYLFVKKLVQNSTNADISGVNFTISVVINDKEQTFKLKDKETYGPIVIPEDATVSVRENQIPENFVLVSISDPVLDGETGNMSVTVNNKYNPSSPPPPPPPTSPPPTSPPPTSPPPTSPPPTSPPPTSPPPTSPPPTSPPPTTPPDTTTPYIPSTPPPHNPGNTIVEDGDHYYEIDENGTPTGEWHQDENGEWVFEEFPPPGAEFIPKTGDVSVFGWAIAFAMAHILFMAMVRLKKYYAARQNTKGV